MHRALVLYAHQDQLLVEVEVVEDLEIFVYFCSRFWRLEQLCKNAFERVVALDKLDLAAQFGKVNVEKEDLFKLPVFAVSNNAPKRFLDALQSVTCVLLLHCVVVWLRL